MTVLAETAIPSYSWSHVTFFHCAFQFIVTVTSAALLDTGEQNTFKCFMYKKHSDIQRLK